MGVANLRTARKQRARAEARRKADAAAARTGAAAAEAERERLEAGRTARAHEAHRRDAPES